MPPLLKKGNLKTNTPSFPAYTAGKMPPLLKKGNEKQWHSSVIARSVSDEAISLLLKGELKTNTPSFPAYTAGKMPPLFNKRGMKIKNNADA